MGLAIPSVSPTSELPCDLNPWSIKPLDSASRVAALVLMIGRTHHILVSLLPEAVLALPMLKEAIVVPVAVGTIMEAVDDRLEIENRASEYCCTVIRNLASVDMVFHDTPSKSWVVLDTNGTTFVADYYPPLEVSLISCCRYSNLGPPNSIDLNLSGQSYNYLDRPQYRLRAMSQLF